MYQTSDEQALREHARRADLADDEILRVSDVVIVRADPPSITE